MRLFKYRNNRPAYYLKNYLRLAVPHVINSFSLQLKLGGIKRFDIKYINERVNYYNKLSSISLLGNDAVILNDFKLGSKGKCYYFDTLEYTRFFRRDLAIYPLFGDITHIPHNPSITKSRPIAGENQNSVLLNLDKARHFNFISDPVSYKNKIDKIVWRVNINQQHRARFMDMYFDNEMCNLGNVSKNIEFPGWQKPRMTIREHLNYKFVLCLEGHDVATNLKWVMSSNSIAVMPEPKYETWFMEGRLIPDFHYIRIKDDYSDLVERLNYFIANPGKAENIISNAHDYISQFKNRKVEDLISIMVLRKYFKMTGQTNCNISYLD